MNLPKTNQSAESDQFISLQEFFSILRETYLIMIAILSIFLTGSIVYSYSLTEEYTSEAILKISNKGGDPSSNNSSSLSISNLITGKGSSNTAAYEVVTIIKSRSFFNKLLSNNPEFLPMLYAADSFDYPTSTISFDVDLYDEENNTWVRKVKAPFASTPSNLEAYEVYLQQLEIVVDDVSPILLASFTHISPIFSSSFLEQIISTLNEYMRNKDLQESSEALRYLESRLQSEPQAEIRKSISALVELQLKKNMYANINSAYAIDVIDAPFIPEIKSYPQKSVIIFIGLLAGLLSSLVTIFILKLRLPQ